MSCAQVAEPEEGKVSENDDETEESRDQEEGGDEQADQHAKGGVEASEAGEGVNDGVGLRRGDRHSILYGWERL
jgi:hypothetical protein